MFLEIQEHTYMTVLSIKTGYLDIMRIIFIKDIYSTILEATQVAVVWRKPHSLFYTLQTEK